MVSKGLSHKYSDSLLPTVTGNGLHPTYAILWVCSSNRETSQATWKVRKNGPSQH